MPVSAITLHDSVTEFVMSRYDLESILPKLLLFCIHSLFHFYVLMPVRLFRVDVKRGHLKSSGRETHIKANLPTDGESEIEVLKFLPQNVNQCFPYIVHLEPSLCKNPDNCIFITCETLG
jgi:hypothetical protein